MCGVIVMSVRSQNGWPAGKGSLRNTSREARCSFSSSKALSRSSSTRCSPRPTLISSTTGDFFDIRGSWENFRQAKRVYATLGFPEQVDLVEVEGRHGVQPQNLATITHWMRRLDESGPDALVQLPEPVNKFPDFVRYSVQRLKSLCPSMGKVKIAGVLARAGLHLGSTTVGRIVKESPVQPPVSEKPEIGERHVTAERPNHVWNVDLTTVPISGGFWVPWSPLTLPQYWPFCWWMAIVLDHYSRRVMGFAVLSVTTFWSFLREFSPLEVYGGGIG